MKCWECKKTTNTATRVSYLYLKKGTEKGRDVCPECYPKLKLNPCHFVEVK